jgi:hypothetical protein
LSPSIALIDIQELIREPMTEFSTALDGDSFDGFNPRQAIETKMFI